MRETAWIHRFFKSTRGQVFMLLRRSRRTVNELAQELGITDNAVRSHLAALEEHGLAEQVGLVRKGVGKPANLYDLTADAELLAPKAYAPVLDLLLDAMAERLSAEELEGLLREVGRRAGGSVAEGDLRARVNAAMELLVELGGDGEVEEGEDGALLIKGYSCPLGAVVTHHPEVCRLAEALVGEVVGMPVRECCEKGERPRCRFEVREFPS